MSKTIKIIDLLVRISKGEEVPKKIKYAGYIFILKKDTFNETTYYEEKEGRNLLLGAIDSTVALNEDVEILEDEETIDIDEIEEIELYSDDGVELYDKEDIHKQGNKINEIIRYLKQINKLEESNEE